MICVVVLQNCMGFVEGETGTCSETCVMCDVDRTEDVGIKVEEAVDVKDEIPEAITFPPIKTEQKVRLFWGGGSSCFSTIYCPKKETVKLHLTVSCFVLCFGCHSFKIWFAILKGRDILKIIAINGRII